MPELPEVEMVVRHLQKLVTKRTIIKAQLHLPKLVEDATPRQFAATLRGACVTSVTRRGKYILSHLDNERTLLTHLGMTGRFLYVGAQDVAPKHTHVTLWLDNGKRLLYEDPRQFGMMGLSRTAELDAYKLLAKLAPETLSEAFTLAYLTETLLRTDQQIKLALLDQTKVLGLGNIYAAEALHRARIHPQTPASQLTKAKLAALHREIVATLTEAIANNSTLNTDPSDFGASYTGGVYESMTKVYERAGQPCLTCGKLIERITQGQRSTYFCSRCQKR
ncbi:MAG: bifunctional DNA-formamidopyrimidine glycosylase/DNA-(apurinic or apyrimidinic site) lyase [Acidobacteria bacterium]|nr:bifunctional DNA-formamidopyrimidine glycosylase/DNA-(apurinic or apyrimidinic site) lyase [Acidobacteriota bacterium]